MSNQLIKTVTKDRAFRAFALDGTDLVRDAAAAHHTSRIASVILGRALLATTLTAQATIKGDERMAAKIAGRGPAGNVVTEADAKGSVRGYVTNPQLENVFDDKGQLDVGQAVGNNGALQITKLAPYSEPYLGQSQLVSGEIGDDFTYYLAQSEQIPSVIGVTVRMDDDDQVQGAVGFLIQALPGVTDAQLTKLEDDLKQMKPLSEMVKDGATPLEILENIFGAGQVETLEVMPVGLAAEPSKEAYAEMLATLPAKEIQTMIDEDQGAEIVGKFSGKRYYFDEAELNDIIKQIEAKEAKQAKDQDQKDGPDQDQPKQD
ncbi:Hsp33 family molecular chaperone HslO [Leuconostocaceae bacterium ESL0723]|nr:Hsp33 family molecular chaperone HslO [Lactobacillaceae bacterium L1_55_11]WEV54240.1 Hsp33 family molecular chaperone HslO [Leuconostocaceae bacterium ESL0723]